MPDYSETNQVQSTVQTQAQTPIITYALIFMCVLFTAAALTGASSSIPAWHKFYEFTTTVDSPERVWSGQYWALIPCLFIHANLLHILFNMMWLNVLGTLMERTMHPLAYIGFILAAGLVSGGCELLWSNGSDIGVGFSGVVYAMFGLGWMGRFRYPSWQSIANPQNMRLMVLWAFGCWIATNIPALNIHIANGAHFSGFVFGLSVGWMHYGKRLRLLAVLPTAAVVVLAVIASIGMPWSGNWLVFKGNQDIEHGDIATATSYYQKAMARNFQPEQPTPFWLFVEGGWEFDRHNYSLAIKYYHECVNQGFEPDIAWHNIAASWHNLGVEAFYKKDYVSMDYDTRQETAATVETEKAQQNGNVTASTK